MRLVEKKVREEWGRIRGPKEGGKEEGRGWDMDERGGAAGIWSRGGGGWDMEEVWGGLGYIRLKNQKYNF